MLMAALVCGFSFVATSCSDDDDNSGKSEEQKEQEAQQKASKFWDVVGQLVADDVTEDYATKTFEPTYGNADPNDPQTRIVNTNDMKTAAKRFADLVGTTKVDENTQTYTYRDDEVGELIYTKGDGTTAWATVDVNIKQLPHLSRIIYRKAGEGENGKFDGKAYYRFGDVVKRTVQVARDDKKNPDNRQSVDEYWICVRPAFGPEGKEDSHWVCVNTIVNNTVKYYHASDNSDYWLPTNLKTNKEQMQNFAELLYAICNPGKWYDQADANHQDGIIGFDGVPIFHDFSKKNLVLHNRYFWQNVQAAWHNKSEIVQKALNLENFDQLARIVNSTDGVHLLYNGYSWWFTTSWDCQLWEMVYTDGKQEDKEHLNYHVETPHEKIEHRMQSIKFDCREMGKEINNYKGFFNDNLVRWTIRHAKGKELASDGKFDVKSKIKGVDEVYRYYATYESEATRKDQKGGDGPEVTPASSADGTLITSAVEGDRGKLICTSGHIHIVGAASQCTAKRVAMVAYVGTGAGADHGLAIALEDLDKGNVKTYEMATNTDSLTKWTQNINVAGGKWKLPAPTDWSYLLIGLYSAQTTFSSDAINNMLGSYNNSSMLTSSYWTDNMSYMKFDQTTKQAVGKGLTSATINNNENRYKIRLVLRF